MSHSYGNIQSEGDIGKGDFDNSEETVHLRLHTYSGGKDRGRMTNLSIDGGHYYESGSSFGNGINIDKKGAIELVSMLNKWIANVEENSDYGRLDEYKVEPKEKSED